MAINQYRETSLHLALKRHLAQPDDLLEAPVGGYIVDILRGDHVLEVQTRNFGAMKAKLTGLLPTHPVTLVHPIALERWLVTLSAQATPASTGMRRKSPKRGHITHIFKELVYLPDELLNHPHLSVCVLMIHDEEIRRDDGQGSWRRRGLSIHDRRLLSVEQTYNFRTTADFATLLPPPPALPPAFTTADLASALKQPRAIAQKMAYCLRRMSVIQQVGQRGKSYCYTLSSVG